MEEKVHQRILRSVSICVMYACASMTFSFAAKFMFNIFAFKNTFSFLLIEVCGNIVFCNAIKLMSKQELVPWTYVAVKENAKHRFSLTIKTLPYSIVYGTSVYCGMRALSLVNIPMFLALRKTLIFFVFAFGLLLGQGSDGMTISFAISVIMITCGAIIAGFHTLNDNLLGYALVICNNCLSSIGLHLAKRLNVKQSFEPLELIYNNSLNLMPVFLTLAIVTGDLTDFIRFESLYEAEFIIFVGVVAILGFCLNYCTNLCTMRNSPFAIALTHNVKDILSTSLSIVVFSDTTLDRYMCSGIALSFTGSFIYSYMKFKQVRRKSQIMVDEEVPQVKSDSEEQQSFTTRRDSTDYSQPAAQ